MEIKKDFKNVLVSFGSVLMTLSIGTYVYYTQYVDMVDAESSAAQSLTQSMNPVAGNEIESEGVIETVVNEIVASVEPENTEPVTATTQTTKTVSVPQPVPDVITTPIVPVQTTPTQTTPTTPVTQIATVTPPVQVDPTPTVTQKTTTKQSRKSRAS